MDDREQADLRARNRFLAINVIRITGVAMVLAGIAVRNGALDLPDWAGWLLIVLGMAEAFLFPTLLARQWSSNDRGGGRR